MMYTQVLTSGYKVRLRDVEREHVVHVAGSHAVICGSQADPKLSSATLISASLKAADAVRTAVGGRLKIEPARVRNRLDAVRPDGSRLCAAASPAPSGAAFIVAAEAEGQTFRYYTDAAIDRQLRRSGAEAALTAANRPKSASPLRRPRAASAKARVTTAAFVSEAA